MLQAEAQTQNPTDEVIECSELTEGVTILFRNRNVHVGRMRKNSGVVVVNGDLTVDHVEENTDLRTTNGNIVVQSLEGKFIRIISAKDVELAQNHNEEIHIIAEGFIKAKNIGNNSSLLARSIHAGDIAQDAVLIASDKVHVRNTSFRVCLASTSDNIEIDYDPPHDGTLSIHKHGTVHYHLQGPTDVSGQAVTLNTAGKVIDHSTKTLSYQTSGKFLERQGNFDVNQHGSIVLNSCFKWVSWLKQRPTEKMTGLEPITQQQLHSLILKILDYTPVDCTLTFTSPAVAAVVDGLPWQICNVDDFFRDVVAHTANEEIQRQKTELEAAERPYSELTRQWPAAVQRLPESEVPDDTVGNSIENRK